MQQEDAARSSNYKSYKKTLQKLQNLTNFCQILTQNQFKSTKKVCFLA